MSSANNLSPTQLIPQAWEAFKRRPWLAVGMWLIYATLSGSGGGSGDPFETEISPEELANFGPLLLAVLIVILFILILAGPIRGGYDLAMLRLLRDDESLSFLDVFAGFSKFGRLFWTLNLLGLILLLGTLLFIVPGIVLALGLWPAFLLVLEDDLEPIEALKAAWALTDGHKAELFVLAIANMVLMIAGLLVFGIGVLVAGPITQLVWVAAYEEMRMSAKASTQAYS
jgi:hypothetical protein